MNLCECGHIYTYHNEKGCGGTVEFKGVAVRNFKPCGCTHYRPKHFPPQLTQAEKQELQTEERWGPPEPPTAPPALEDARDAAAKFTKRNYSLPSGHSVHDAMARFAIEYAAKRLERERGRIEREAVERFAAELSLECDDKMPVEQWQAVVFAMQTVKQRIGRKG